MTYGYIRVSTEEQTFDNQKIAIEAAYKIDKWVEEKRSGTLDYKKRSLGELIARLQAGDVLVITELSRLGRSLSMIFKIVNELKEKKIRLIAIKNSFDMKAGAQNDIVTDVLLFAFGLSAQIERQLISERTKQGLVAARERGRHPGRRKGVRPYYVKLRDDQADIMRKRAAGASVLSLAREYGVRWQTMRRFITIYAFMAPPPPLVECPRRHGHPSRREIEYFKIH
jgi:DNA invertase Pin-like site-specific DNA recombinase